MRPSAPAPVATVDEQNPWLGLVSFTEETMGYFHGREEEAAELSRRVQRKLLTILFGQSGLGKTSILQAGLVPRLRPEGFCPVYVRLDYSPGSPPPSEQIKRAVFQATEAAGTWTQVGSSISGESLWEFLHHRDDVLKDAGGRTLVPILIFDQFEEIFTLAQSDDAGRRRAQEFLADLADLVENRPPAALEAKIDRDETDAARFDFARADYRILISLREDYLAHLEGLKAQMPSVTQNRMRLARMTGVQAVSAVRSPAPGLVSQSVAEAIVRFVAGGTDLAHAEVEPSLLSLICRELNNTRLAKGQAEISADLLAGSRDTILSEFYERALADQPAGVRVFIEDEMLTDSGFRESIAEERVRKGFAAAGAPAESLAVLVNRRLLRVEDRLDLRRVEITHDVLCSVIAASRGVRRAREALEESKRQLEAQKQKEAATRRSLVRARTVAAVSAVLMVVAAGSAVFGWVNLRRARQAEAQTQVARQLAENARGESEKLVGFLLDEFYEELAPTGRVEIVRKLADRAVAYYDNLPPELTTDQTRYYQGMALVRKADALGQSGDADGATKVAAQAAAIFEKLRASGDRSENVALGLALAWFSNSSSGFLRLKLEDCEKAANLLRPYVASGHASRETKVTLADIFNFSCHMMPLDEGIAACEEGRKALADTGALDFTDLTAASVYADVCDSEARLMANKGRLGDARRLETKVADMAHEVIAKRPGDLRAMRDAYFSEQFLGTLESRDEDLVAAEPYFRRTVEAGRIYTQFNPSEALGWYLYTVSFADLGSNLFEQGRVAESLAAYAQPISIEAGDPARAESDNGYYVALLSVADTQAKMGRYDEALEGAERMRADGVAFAKASGTESFADLMNLSYDTLRLRILANRDGFAAVLPRIVELRPRVARVKGLSRLAKETFGFVVRGYRDLLTEAEFGAGDYQAAVTDCRYSLAHLDDFTGQGPREIASFENREKVRLGAALAAQGHKAEARDAIGQALTYYEGRRAKGANGTTFRIDYAWALYALAVAQDADDAGRAARLSDGDRASGVLFGLTLEAQDLVRAKELARLIAAEKASSGPTG
jgi:tetratricopeptide (TPR) repeat protein